MKILSAAQIREVDAYTIEHEPVKSIDLMERAARACFKRVLRLVEHDTTVFVFCGKGNNGGDGLALARMLCDSGFHCMTVIVNHSEKFSEDAQHNFNRLKEKYASGIIEINAISDFASIPVISGAVAIDALLGTGIHKPAQGLMAEVIQFINSGFKYIISIDVPSGLYTNANSGNNKNIIRASITLTFQCPKLAFLLPQNGEFVQSFEVLDIGLHNTAIAAQKTNHYYITYNSVRPLLKPRKKFSHKGSYGHALLMAGSKGKSGAAIISAKAAMRSGCGLLTVSSNSETIQSLLNHLPEAMSMESDAAHIEGIDKPENFDAIAFGPGVGFHEDTQQTLKKILQYYSGNLVIDADGLTILSENKTWLSFLPAETILTPHPKEFEHLCGKQNDDFERLDALKQFSIKHNCIVVLKGAHTAVAMPDGNTFFNSNGNAGLAKAGSGDGLTGIILGLLARGYTPPQAALIGVYMHGLAADLYTKKRSAESMLISDAIELLPKAFKRLET